MHVIYTGERVRLRPFASAEEFIKLDDNFMAVPNPFWGPDWRSHAKRTAEFTGNGLIDPLAYSAFAVERLDTGELIGIEECGDVHATKLYTWIGTFILADHRRQGFGIEAKQLMMCHLFENLPLSSILAVTMSNHARALAGLQVCGMRHIGYKRRVRQCDGKVLDEVMFQILREEWEQLPIRRIVKRGA
ncbi:GNAT family N-acetyltransferase [bacterium]|nr:GNAT family N-acetyltransferase [bacterium]